MCELISIAAAILFTALAFSAHRRGAPAGALTTTALAFWGASLMWAVDCVHSLMEGDGLLDLSAGDAALGGIVFAAGLALFAVLRIREGRRTATCGAAAQA